MNVVDVQDGIVRAKKKQAFEVIEEHTFEESHVTGDNQVQFETNIVDDGLGQGAAKKKKKKKKKATTTSKKLDEDEAIEGDDLDSAQIEQ